jgi:hypothetical protein
MSAEGVDAKTFINPFSIDVNTGETKWQMSVQPVKLGWFAEGVLNVSKLASKTLSSLFTSLVKIIKFLP